MAYYKSMFPYALLPHHKGAKQNTIGVIRRVIAKLPHHRSFMPSYPMENVATIALGLRSRQGGWKVVDQEGDPGVTSHASRECKEYKGMNPHTPK
jgi:hypothetical protein